ncbi:hypothetical protein HPP92_002980 [Vanilla planifolia]|uniref:SUF system FeS cluster assembly SufBD core domain-containing protein n=1 Tax=Vanilla planifolia TaxID=51239 RepID=A0A835SFR7_VANPL|nr:hypothetical protein HPP92_002980 [Vanilla planifolia]
MMCSSLSAPLVQSGHLGVRPRPRPRPVCGNSLQFQPKILDAANSASSSSFSVSDPFVLEIADKLEDSLSLTSSSFLKRLRDSSALSILSRRWPSSKDELFRFTDTSFLKSSKILPTAAPSAQPPISASPVSNFLTIVDGHVLLSLSHFPSLPPGAFAGSAADVPPGSLSETVLATGTDGFREGDLFWDLNGFGAPDLAVVYIPEGERMIDEPLHLRLCASEMAEAGSGVLPLSNPRVLVVVGKRAELGIIEEHFGTVKSAGSSYWSNSVLEIVLEEGAKVSHSFIQTLNQNAAHVKWTSVRQGECSIYELVEVSTGGKLFRHNLHIQQLGRDTTTELSTLHISQDDQIQDLHSRLILDHPGGFSRQLHKCMVLHSSGHAIFDGNIKVNRFAQKTDAGQLTRTLLLAPRATVNVKPNLQIVADDVKCSHGAAISDLEEEQLFYFQVRGIDLQTARDAIIFSFGSEVLGRIPFEPFRNQTSEQVKELLKKR